MSIEYLMRAICDKCGAEIEPLQVVKATEMGCTRWRWYAQWKERSIMRGEPNLFGKAKLYCKNCAG